MVFDGSIAQELYPDRSWQVLGVDSQSWVYVEVDEQEVDLVSNGEVLATTPMRVIDYGTMVFDGGLATGNRYELTVARFDPYLERARRVPIGDSHTWRLPYKLGWDPPGAMVSVSPDGELIYVSSEFEAWIWDREGHLMFDLGTVYPSPYNIYGLP